jgi:hypothetical protein
MKHGSDQTVESADTWRERYLTLLALLPRCSHSEYMQPCQRLATRRGQWHDSEEAFCDEHAGGACDLNQDRKGPALPWAAHVREYEPALAQVSSTSRETKERK